MTAHLAIDATIVRPPCSGVQNSVLAEALALKRLRGDCRIYGFAEGCDETPPQYASRVAGRILWQQLLFPSILRKSGASALFAAGYTCPIRAKLPVILQVHDIIAIEHPEYCATLNSLHIKTLLPPSIRRADRIVVSTDHVRFRLIHHFPNAAVKTVVIPLGVDCERFSEAPKAPNFLGRPYILFVGNIEPKKGLDILLDAWEQLMAETDRTLVIAGRIAWKSGCTVSRMNRLARTGRLVIAGRISDAELPSLYANADAFVFPSLEEGFGMPVLEAMSAGTPVVHSDHPAVMEAAGGAGLPFRTGSAESLSMTLKRLLDSPPLQSELSARGRERAKRCTWQSFAESIINIYNTLK